MILKVVEQKLPWFVVQTDVVLWLQWMVVDSEDHLD